MSDKSKMLFALDFSAAALLLAATWMVFFRAPLEAVMGPVQKVFYFHVASAWVGMLSFLVAAGSGIIYLRRKQTLWDIAETSAVEIGMVFGAIAVLSGSVWAKPIWNTWWTWDPRLTTVTIMLLIYAAYFMLRSGIDDPDRRARFSAVYAIIGVLSVPLTFLSARLFRTIHPIVIGANQSGAAGAFDMTDLMRQTFFLSLFAFSVLFASLLLHRIRLGVLEEELDYIRYSINP